MNKVKFGKRIAELRKAQGLTRKELAQILNISYAHINNIELGTRTPSLEIIIRIARELHVPSGFLFQQLDNECSFPEFFDIEAYLPLPLTFSRKDREGIKEYVPFKERREGLSSRSAGENEIKDKSQPALPLD